jgi:hypothetical protein
LWIRDLQGNGKDDTSKIQGDGTEKRLRTVVIPEWAVYFHVALGSLETENPVPSSAKNRGQVPMYSHFDYYAGHLAVVKKQMLDWRPRTLREMYKRGYADRFSWYVSWVSLTFAALGIIAVVTSIMQAYWASEALMLQKQQTLNGMN